MNNRKDTKLGFTLAEVLITLVIIGVIAAFTIPTLIKNYQKEQTAIKIKKVYSTLSNTTNLAISNNGSIETWDLSGTSEDFVKTYLLPYLNVSKYCGRDTTGVCGYQYTQSNSASVVLPQRATRFYLNDGTLIAVTLENIPEVALTAMVKFDINGQAPPNKTGRDLFELRYIIYHRDYMNYLGKFIPNCFGFQGQGRNYWLNSSSYGCNNGSGTCCLALIYANGWKIPDDYPW